MTTATIETVPAARVVLRDESEVTDLIADLRRCLRESRRTGGAYTAGITDDGGKIAITVWVKAT